MNPATRSPTLVVTTISKRFGGLRAVDGVSLQVSAGEVFGLIGPNGAGKTTLFSMIAGAIRPDAGRIEFLGQDVTGATPERMCDLGLTRTFQIPRPFGDQSVFQNALVGGIACGRGLVEARELARAALETAGLTHRAQDPAGILPLGQLKRLEVARCLATSPKVVLLDEITGGLNPEGIADMIRLIRRLAEQHLTLVVIEHNMSVVREVCQRILVLNQGKPIAEGTHAEISSDPHVIEAYLGTAVVDA